MRIGSVLLRAGVLALGVWLVIDNIRANEDAAETHALVLRLERENAGLRNQRDRLECLNEALERGDEEAVRRALQRYGYIPANRVVVLEQGDDGR
ncbi:MAG: hypothetical protein CMJ83_00860 [Planctomycetes bacterium]|nr:hypothetical protein [Planctomycetota bacterium]